MNSVNIVKARTSFEAKMESGKANSFKSPAEAEHSTAGRKLEIDCQVSAQLSFAVNSFSNAIGAGFCI